MEVGNEKKDLTDILTEILTAVPAGFVFDDVYIIERLAEEYPDAYLKFMTLYPERDKPAEIARRLGMFEGILVKEQDIKIHFPSLHGTLTSHKLWKKL